MKLLQTEIQELKQKDERKGVLNKGGHGLLGRILPRARKLGATTKKKTV